MAVLKVIFLLNGKSTMAQLGDLVRNTREAEIRPQTAGFL
jgi:hypothetical protein